MDGRVQRREGGPEMGSRRWALDELIGKCSRTAQATARWVGEVEAFGAEPCVRACSPCTMA
eukprot:319391-Chlamydomonas_euryale.AAC.1